MKTWEILQAVMTRRGLTQEAVASLISVRQAWVSDTLANGREVGGDRWLRRADVLSLRWEDLDGGWIRRRTQKTGEAVSVPLHPELLAFLEPAKEDQGPIAPLGARGGAIHKRTLILCGTPWGSHALRRGFLNLLLEAGVDPRVRADLAGHGVEVELKHYNKSSDRLLLEALNTIKLRPSSAKEEGSATS